ncbi:MAG TPA: PKD domain-containing protein, partial [Bacteroidales bacterium]|nr:PKD domain-containing protein [Bacteroidales bacterium]
NKYSPPLSLGYDIRVPYGFCDTAISAYKPWFTSYLWSTGETDSVIHVNKPGVYSCTVTDIFGFESSDDIRVFYPQVNNFADTIICYGNSVIWDAELTGDYSYEWLGSPETTQSIEIFYEGDYALIITDSLGCKYYSDTINFSFDKYELTASIGPADTSLCAGNRLSLVTNSDETVSYNWNTGETTPEITITESGTYSVTCTNWRACSAEDEIAVTIMGTVPNPDFSVQGHCAKNLISFNDQSTSPEGNINFWQWFVNGEVFASSQNSEITLDEPGNYNIRLQIKTDLDCGDYLDETIEVFPLPEPKFFPDYYCQWAEIDFISKTTILSGNILNNYWQFNDFDLFGDTVSYVFENSGINTVKLISESEQACRDSIIKEIFVKQAVKPDFLSQNACVNSESSFINITEQSSYNLPVSWNWNFGDGNFGENSDPSHVYENSGIYDVSLSVVWQNTCETSITKQIEIYDNPELELLVENSCVNSEFTVAKNIESQSGEIVEYIWNFNGNEIISNTDASPTFVCDTIGEYPISLEIKSEYGCEAFAQDTIKVYPLPQVDFAMSRDWGGFPFTVDFTNLSQGASQYLWSFGDSESSIEENPTHIYISEGEFFVNLTAVSEYGCSDYIEKKIISVNPIMDLILYDLRTKLNGNYLEISVYIINNGTLPVSKPELVLNLGEGKIYRESLDSIPVSQVIDYTLKTEIWRAEKTLPEIICLEVFANPYEGHYENNTEDNLICSANVKNLLVFQPYPNPTNQSLNIEYILAKPAECLITITNSMGKQVYVNKFENQTQYNKLELDVSEFAVGVYYLQVQSGGERESRKVVVY